MKTISLVHPIILSLIFLLLFGISGLFFYASHEIQNIRNLNQKEIIIWNNIRNNINFLFKSEQGANSVSAIQKRIQVEIHNLLEQQKSVHQEIAEEITTARSLNFLDWPTARKLDSMSQQIVDPKLVRMIESISRSTPTLLNAGVSTWDTGLMLSLQSQTAFEPILERENDLSSMAKRTISFLWSAVWATSIIILTLIWFTWWKVIRPSFNRVQNSQEQLLAIWDSIGEGVLTLDGDGKITNLNPKASELFNSSKSELQTLHLCDLISSDSKDGFTCDEMLSNIYANPLSENGAKNLYMQYGEDEPFPISYSVAPLVHQGKGQKGAVFVFRDVTAEQALRTQSAQSERLRSLGLLIGGIAHDFNNLLAGISGAAEVLEHKQEKKLNQQEKMLLHIISTQVDRGVDLTTKLTDFSKNRAESYSRLSIKKVISEVIEILDQTKSVDVKLAVNLNVKDDLIDGSHGLLHSAIMNLCINALHAVKDNGTISIALKNSTMSARECDKWKGLSIKPGNFIDIQISDTGIGISDDDLAQIFDPFFTTKPTGKGSGLGLSAAYGVARDHGGMILATSKRGKGSVFTMRIPLTIIAVPEEATSIVSQLPPAANDSNKVKRALIVEDEDAQRENYGHMLQILGFTAEMANGGKAALKILDRTKETFDIVLLDVNMPDINGVEAFNEIAKTVPKENIVIITGHTSAENIMTLRGNGANRWLIKPFKLKQLRDLISR